jgi:MFS family permease
LGGIAGLRLRLRRPLLFVGGLFILTAAQNLILAFHPSVLLLVPAAAAAGFAFSLATVVWDSAIQCTMEPAKLARVSAYSWMGAMVFLPAGYALAGPISSVVGLRGDLTLAAAWVVVSTLFILQLRCVREFTLEPAVEAAPAVA